MGVHTIAISYIPNPDPEAILWLENFLSTLEVKPSTFGVDPRDVAALGGHIRDFRERLAVAQRTLARTNRAIVDATIARNAAVILAQRLVQVIKANPLTTNDDLAVRGVSADA